MGRIESLTCRLGDWIAYNCRGAALAATIERIAATTVTIAELIARGPLAGTLGAVVGNNADGDAQKELDLRANQLLLEALRDAPVAVFGSEEIDTAVVLDADAPLAVAVDPLDGSSNIDTNLTIGTIFSVLPNLGDDPATVLLQPGASQLAAGFVVYGPQTALVLTLGRGAHIFVLDRCSGEFMLARADAQIPTGRREYAINASNYRHWEVPVRAYIDDCVSGAEGPRGANFNMRWNASLVAEAYRILARGGIYLYPRDDRAGYHNGRLRLVYEANPIAFLAEQAGGAAIDGEHRILDLVPRALHQRVPLVFGSRDKVARVADYHREPHGLGERSPLFGRRGLFRA
jgi:fructose-1,6-bisphosphatase I